MKYKNIISGSLTLVAIVYIAIDGEAFNKKLFEVVKELSFTIFIVQHFFKHSGGLIKSIASEITKKLR